MPYYNPQTHSMDSRNMHGNIGKMHSPHSDMYEPENIDKLPIAMAYVPWQRWKNTYELGKALKVGTIFPELDLPYLGRRGERS